MLVGATPGSLLDPDADGDDRSFMRAVMTCWASGDAVEVFLDELERVLRTLRWGEAVGDVLCALGDDCLEWVAESCGDKRELMSMIERD